ncbi:acetoacetate--CoA ligase [Vibrio penaeicida]|uniref:acetoacetate--CoA ligase n=1 Tax=Vibrio penaeicida TaxID=104609 RepID=UPI000CEA40DA|nr:acetoacetate--CoA ligase [Vibrio penaeicida]
MTGSKPIWVPTSERIENALITDFIQQLNSHYALSISTYDELQQWSVDASSQFWQFLWDYVGVVGVKGEAINELGPSKWQDSVISRDTLWFPEATLNYAENLLTGSSVLPQSAAIEFYNERGETSTLSWEKLEEQVSTVQQWLQDCGVKRGDVVAGYLPYLTETVVAMLATTSLGAIWTSTSPDFGIDSVLERFGQVKPKVLFCCDGYSFAGKNHDMRNKNQALSEHLDSLKQVCQIEYLNLPPLTGSISWTEVNKRFSPKEIEYCQVGFNEPLFILYSSGTTGKPKCITHSVGGTLLNHKKEHQLHCDIKAEERVFYYTTCGWMMWNWHVSALASGATLVVFDGSPVYPNEGVLWDISHRSGVSLFGTSAKYLAALEKNAYSPKQNFNLSAVRTLCSTGSALYPEQFDYVYQHIGQDIHLASISGGTDICGCFVLGNPISPVYRGECQGRGLGLSVDVVDENGSPLRSERGELVCLNSFPNQPVGFWNDSGERYHNAYWDKFENVWHHGDDVVLTNNNGMIFYGRSDTVLNPGGVRIGTAEIYQQVNQLEGITDSIAVGQQWDGDERIILFVQLEKTHSLSDDLIVLIKNTLKTRCSPRHVPAVILAVSDIPRTKSGKLVEVAVKEVIHGNEVKNIGAIANPEVLGEIASVFGRI